MATEYDVLIMGAGISGCSAAITCAEHGLRPLVIDCHPQEYCKPCGDGLTESSVLTLTMLGISTNQLLAVGANYIKRSVHFWSNGRTEITHQPNSFFTLPRRQLLICLRDRAMFLGTHFIYNEKQKPTFHNGSWKIGEKNTASELINATGCQSGLWQDPDKRKKLPLGCTAISQADTKLDEHTVWFWHFCNDPVGYAWAFPLLNKKWNIGVWGKENVQIIRQRMQNFLQKWEVELCNSSVLTEKPHYAFLGTEDTLKKLPSISSWYAAGDIVGSCMLLNGEGISNALVSGINAADLCL